MLISSEQVKEHLKDYFDKSHQAFGQQRDQGLCLLCIQCFEVRNTYVIIVKYHVHAITSMILCCIKDALYKEYNKKSFARRVKETTDILDEGLQACQHEQHTNNVTLEYLEGVAKVRYALSVVAELLNQIDHACSYEDSVLVDKLLGLAREVCVDPNINIIGQGNTVGPAVFLIKLLVRQYGLKYLYKASEAHAWVVPEQLKQTGVVRNIRILDI